MGSKALVFGKAHADEHVRVSPALLTHRNTRHMHLGAHTRHCRADPSQPARAFWPSTEMDAPASLSDVSRVAM